MKKKVIPLLFALFCMVVFSCKKSSTETYGTLQLQSVSVGATLLSFQGSNTGIPVDSILTLSFSSPLDTTSARASILLRTKDNSNVPFQLKFSTDFTKAILILPHHLDYMASYTLLITSSIRSRLGETFPGVTVPFTTVKGTLQVKTITLNGKDFSLPHRLQDISWQSVTAEIVFSEALDSSNYTGFFTLSGPVLPGISISLSSDKKKVTLTNTSPLADYSKYYLNISSNLTSKNGYSFSGFVNSFYTALDSSYKFPPLTDDELLTLVQRQTFKYFYDFAHPACGMARERNNSGDLVAMGGSGFGVMALIVGMDRGFITRAQGIARLGQILTFLETCDRFHGAWPHWLDGNTGKVHPFSTEDDGADLVETSYMVEGLLTMRQYLDSTNVAEKVLIGRINTLYKAVEFDWFTQGGQNVLYWNWSPNYGWALNLKIQGYNETLITYLTAASSPTHSISKEVYTQGYARNGDIRNGKSFYGYYLPLGEDYGGPLFFTHYTYLGLDPRNLSDQFANYWQQNVNQSLINFTYCKTNPKGWIGYNANSWGLTASDNPWGYNAQSPTNDLGVITPTAAVSALPYVPLQSMNAIRHFYYILGNRLWGPYGFYDAFDVTQGWWASSYIAIDEGPIICMIENYRTQLLWNLFMSCPEVRQGLTKLGFSYK